MVYEINQYPFGNLGGDMDARIETDARGRKTVENACDRPCAIERGMRILGGKWTGSILWHLKEEPVRFNDLARMVGGASKKMVTERLRQLEARGLVSRRVIDGGPITVEYSITPFGKTALEFLDVLRRWSEDLPPELSDDV
jgi:DNA-binding HxlR family transcriptional regulator